MTINNLLAGGVPDTITNPVFKGTNFDVMISTEEGGSLFLAILLPKLIGILFVVGVVSFFFMFLWGAVSWILSGGDKAHIESAKGRITSALVGVILLLGSFAIIKLVETFFGVDILSIDIGPLIIQ